jgi:hypothetical protein
MIGAEETKEKKSKCAWCKGLVICLQASQHQHRDEGLESLHPESSAIPSSLNQKILPKQGNSILGKTKGES